MNGDVCKEVSRVNRLENGLRCLEIDGRLVVGLGAFLRTARQILRYELRRSNEEFSDWSRSLGVLTTEIEDHIEKMSMLVRCKKDVEMTVELAKSNGHFEECKLDKETVQELYYLVEKAIMDWEPEDEKKYVSNEELWRGPEERWNRNWNAKQWEDFMIHLTAYYYRTCIDDMRDMTAIECEEQFTWMYNKAHDLCPTFMLPQWEEKCKLVGLSEIIGLVDRPTDVCLTLKPEECVILYRIVKEHIEELEDYAVFDGAEDDLKENLIKEAQRVQNRILQDWDIEEGIVS